MTLETNKVLIITGGSRGIGASTALLAANQGYDIGICYQRSEERAEKIVKQIQSIGRKAIAIKTNICNPIEVEKLFGTIEKSLGLPIALVNNAGISGPRVPFIDLKVKTIQHVFETNLIGSFLCSQQAVKRMARSQGGKGGSIVNVSSQAAIFGGQNLAPYAAAKAGINTFTLALSKEVASEGIRVNAVSPGIIDTEMHNFSDLQSRDKMCSKIPLGRLGTPAEVAEAITWLLSEKAAYITGAILPVSGGK